MILHTTIPQELIFQTNQLEQTKELMLSYNGIPILAEQVSEFEYRIKNIISTDPNHYLHPSVFPGSTISSYE